MVSIIVEYKKGDAQLFEHYWCPLLHKYKTQNVEFLFVDETFGLKNIMPKLSNAKIYKNTKSAINESKYKSKVFTPIDIIPTYAAMGNFKKLKNNQSINMQLTEILKSPVPGKPGFAVIDNIMMYKVERE